MLAGSLVSPGLLFAGGYGSFYTNRRAVESDGVEGDYGTLDFCGLTEAIDLTSGARASAPFGETPLAEIAGCGDGSGPPSEVACSRR